MYDQNGVPTPQPEQPAQPPVDAFSPPPTPPVNNFIAQPDPPKKGRKGLIATIIILVVLLIGAIGVIVFLAYFQPKSTKTTTANGNTSSGASTQDKNEAKELIATIRSAVTDKLATTYPNMSISDGTYAPIYKADTVNYGVASSDIGISLNIDTDAKAYNPTGQAAVEKVATDVFKSQSSLKVTSQDWQSIYQNDTIICTLSSGSSPAVINCANKKDYTALITQVAPFADAFFSSKESKTFGPTVVFATPKISQKANGYRNATLSMSAVESPVGGAAGLFYAKDGNWSYWRATQSIIPCADYATSDLQRAFEGDQCSDANGGLLTVKVKN